MLNVLLVSPFAKDANSFYRALGPWNYLKKKLRHDGVNFSTSLAQDDLGHGGVAWDTVDQFDAVFLHRACREDDLTILKIAKTLGVPVWVDYDDWLFEVPYWNPCAGIYNNPGVQNVIATCLATADVVSVSTSALYDRFRLVNKNVVIIPNMYRQDLYTYRDETPPPRSKHFFWRGTNTHDADLLSVADGFKDLPAKTHFWGGPTWMLLNQMRPGSYEIMGSQDPFLYMKNLYRSAPKVLLFPLLDCFFNRVKSNIAYQEALHAGAICVAPDMPEWQHPGVVTYEPSNSQSFAEAATQAMEMGDADHAKAVAEAFEHMKGLYGADRVTKIREDVLSAIVAKDFEKNNRDPFDGLVGVWSLGQLKKTQEPLQKRVTA